MFELCCLSMRLTHIYASRVHCALTRCMIIKLAIIIRDYFAFVNTKNLRHSFGGVCDTHLKLMSNSSSSAFKHCEKTSTVRTNFKLHQYCYSNHRLAFGNDKISKFSSYKADVLGIIIITINNVAKPEWCPTSGNNEEYIWQDDFFF